jgi:hypothetical protein
MKDDEGFQADHWIADGFYGTSFASQPLVFAFVYIWPPEPRVYRSIVFHPYV